MFKEITCLKTFFENPEREFNVREIARIQGIAPATASKKLQLFEKEQILTHRKERMLDLYHANLESESYRDLKTYYTISTIRNSGLINSLNEFYGKPTIILFGSTAKGLDTENSDIDLVILSENIKEFPRKKQFEKTLSRELQLFRLHTLKDLKNKHLINSVLNGILLQGEIRWT